MRFQMNPLIKIVDLAVQYHVGVPDAERANAQRLLLCIDMSFDFCAAAAGDDIVKTINYFDVSQKLLRFGDGRSWKLIEKLAVDIANFVHAEFRPLAVTVEVKKFPIPEAAHVSVVYSRK